MITKLGIIKMRARNYDLLQSNCIQIRLGTGNLARLHNELS